jgi:hypothetical protein
MEAVDNASFDTILTLPTATTGAELADQCREAALQFINQSKSWGKAELVMWLTGSYGPLVRHTSKGECDSPLWPVPLLRDIDARLVDRIIESARAEILETLALSVHERSASFVLRALIAGSVVRCEDSNGNPAWAPTSSDRLADRVLTLLAVDYLTRSEDYETALVICSECRTISFDRHATNHARCRHDHPTKSLTAPRRMSTIPYPPIGA